ncbi:MAG TPA: helix-turn-helix domain-containing protein [Blastocatellia bacterium]|nr:helix-turn-helix domain-containing protein [Blastocatellia bacterium]
MASDTQPNRKPPRTPDSGEAETADAARPDLASGKRVDDKKVEYLTARQLANVLQVSESTVHRLRRAGRIPAVALTDRLIRFNLRDVQKALKSTVVTESQNGQANEEPSPQLSFGDIFSNFG